jgi:hypothetical protein
MEHYHDHPVAAEELIRDDPIDDRLSDPAFAFRDDQHRRPFFWPNSSSACAASR